MASCSHLKRRQQAREPATVDLRFDYSRALLRIRSSQTGLHAVSRRATMPVSTAVPARQASAVQEGLPD